MLLNTTRERSHLYWWQSQRSEFQTRACEVQNRASLDLQLIR